MKNEKQTSGWEQKVNDIEGLPGGLKVYIKGLMRAERLTVAKAMAEAVVPAYVNGTTERAMGWDACRSETVHRAEEFIAKL